MYHQYLHHSMHQRDRANLLQASASASASEVTPIIIVLPTLPHRHLHLRLTSPALAPTPNNGNNNCQQPPRVHDFLGYRIWIWVDCYVIWREFPMLCVFSSPRQPPILLFSTICFTRTYVFGSDNFTPLDITC